MGMKKFLAALCLLAVSGAAWADSNEAVAALNKVRDIIIKRIENFAVSQSDKEVVRWYDAGRYNEMEYLLKEVLWLKEDCLNMPRKNCL